MALNDWELTPTGEPWRGPPSPPGFAPARLIALARERVKDIDLDLRDKTVFTEAATGVYVVTPILAAIAGARRVFALARDSRHGSAIEAITWLRHVAEMAGVADVISIVDKSPDAALGSVDIVTNCGHLRPIERRTIDALPPHAVIALMFEAWERRASDIDFEACAERGIAVVGVNERHASVDVFRYLGSLAVKLLHDAGVAVYRSNVALVCDNDFSESLRAGLEGQGADVTQAISVQDLPARSFDAVLVALKPAEGTLRLGRSDAHQLVTHAPNAIIAQFWGDIDRSAFLDLGIPLWPRDAPAYGHMGILLSAIGPEPVVRLQAGGLKAAEIALAPGLRDGETLAQFI